jgi:hypothetical protein
MQVFDGAIEATVMQQPLSGPLDRWRLRDQFRWQMKVQVVGPHRISRMFTAISHLMRRTSPPTRA